MSEENTTKISVRFERKLDLGSYQNTTASAWVEANVPAGDAAAISAALGDAFGRPSPPPSRVGNVRHVVPPRTVASVLPEGSTRRGWKLPASKT